MTKFVDNNKMILNPVRFGRCKENLEVGEVGIFNSKGWIISGTVQKRYGDLWEYDSYHGYYIYLIQDIIELNYYGVEETETEYLDRKKKEDRAKQLKLKHEKKHNTTNPKKDTRG